MKKKLFFLTAFILAIAIDLKAQCPNSVNIASADKCFEMVWTTPPSPLPATLTYNSVTYNYNTGAGTSASPAIYKDVTNPNCGNFSLFSGSITIGGYTCTYVNGVLTNQTMPLKIVDFKYFTLDNQLKFSWITQDETGVLDFTLERAGNSFSWIEIGKINATGKSYEKNDYELYDVQPLSGKNYYRLKITDIDGELYYSPVLSYENKFVKNRISVYPNPADDILNLNYDENFKPLYIEILDMKGNKVLSLINADNRIDISNIETGIYILKAAFENGEISTEKIMVK